MIFRRSFPLYLQYDAMDCGPTCLRMAAKYYWKSYSLQFLRDRSSVTREGTSLLGLCEAARAIGFKASCVRVSLEYLAGKASLPCIVHWDSDHFVVVYRIDRKYVHVADPAFGKTKYAKEMFLSRWASADESGYALMLAPEEGFSRLKEEPGGGAKFFSVLSIVRSYRHLFARLLAAMLIGSLIQLVPPFLTQMIVDRGINGKDIHFLMLVLLAQFVLVVSRVSVNMFRGWTLFHLSTPLNIRLVHEFLRKLMRMPLGYFDVKMIGDILQRIGDHQRVEYFLSSTALSILLTVVNLTVFGSILAIYNLRIFLILAAGVSAYLIWIRIFLARRREVDFLKFRQMGKNQSALIQMIMGMQEIRLNTCEEKKMKDWMKIQDDLLAVGRKSIGLTQKQQSGCALIQETQNILITFASAYLVIDGGITLGMMLAIQFILGQLNGPVEQLLQFVTSAQDARISFERIEEIHSLREERDAGQTNNADVPTQGDIVVSHLSFRYPGPSAEKVLDDLSLVLRCGMTTAIVGPSGSGKTTLLKLLLGIYRPERGDIAVGGISLSDISFAAWRRKCGMVMQEGYIFSDSIAENIALSDASVDEIKVKQAAGIAHIDAFIEGLPSGYLTKIGGEGHGLSQGQKQRILIARAVYKDPDYIFFDEATNSLDTDNEEIVVANLNRFFHGKTTIVVAHRLSTVRNADNIIVMDQGTVVEQGTHSQLIDRQGYYFRLVNNQLDS